MFQAINENVLYAFLIRFVGHGSSLKKLEILSYDFFSIFSSTIGYHRFMESYFFQNLPYKTCPPLLNLILNLRDVLRFKGVFPCSVARGLTALTFLQHEKAL